MQLEMLKAKLHRATVTQTNLNYHGSITIDSSLLKAAGILPYEKVEIANLNNGSRMCTYVIEGKSGSGIIGLNGASARLSSVGDKIIILCYALCTEEEARGVKPRVIILGESNQIIEEH